MAGAWSSLGSGNHGAGADVSEAPRGYRPCVIRDATIIASCECGLCKYILKQPCQVVCGHQFCERCLQFKLQSEGRIACPACASESETLYITAENYQPDYACRKRMGKLAAYCENRGAGCDWDGRLRQLDDHLAECDYTDVTCSECHQVMQRHHLSDHTRNDCLGAEIDTSGPCVFGCRDLALEVNIEAHNIEQCALHLDVICQALVKFSRLTRGINKLSQRLSELPSSDRVAQVTRAAQEINREVDEAKENLKKMENSSKTSTSLINSAFKEVQRLAARLVEAEKLFQTQFIGSPSGELCAPQREMALLSEQLGRQSMSYDGVLLWEIYGVAQKIAEGKTGNPLNSPVFSTGSMGYHLMARIYMAGDGTGRDRFISLFIVVLKGPADGALSWPLKQLVHFTLFDLSGNREHHKYTFCTDPSSTSFARPRQAANIASGSPKFISLHEFNQRYDHFVQEDTMILEIRVDQGLPVAC